MSCDVSPVAMFLSLKLEWTFSHWRIRQGEKDFQQRNILHYQSFLLHPPDDDADHDDDHNWNQSLGKTNIESEANV